MKNIIFTLLFILPFFAQAQGPAYYPEGFESDIKTESSEKLKSLIFEILTSHHQKVEGQNDVLVAPGACKGNCYSHINLGYKKARTFLFGKIDLLSDEKGFYLKDVYCQKEFRRPDIGSMLIPDQEAINCEHTWPQSKFSQNFSKELQKSDLNHLFVTSSKANSVRGNNAFGETLDESLEDCEASSTGTLKDDFTGKNLRVFNPPNEHKGNVARALFYFSVRYKVAIDPMQEKTLREWAQRDPVDQEERERNAMIQEIQGNRNPFIDYPELAQLINDF